MQSAFKSLAPVCVALLALLIAGPFLLSIFGLILLSSYTAMAVAVLGLAFVWGTVGLLSLGHAAFFGLGSYTYAIVAVNLQDSTPAILAASVVPAVFAAILGFFLIWGLIAEISFAVITLCVTLVLYSFTTSTADPAYHIGSVHLGGFNGIAAVPPLNWPGAATSYLSVEAGYCVAMAILLFTYLALRLLQCSTAGRIMVAVRESERRAMLLGYDPRPYKLLGFVVSASVAGLGGALLTGFSGYVGPSVFALDQASQFILCVIAGGLGTLAGPMVACFVLMYLATVLGSSGMSTNLVFGAIIMGFVLLAPNGMLPALQRLWQFKPAGRTSRSPAVGLRKWGWK